MAALSAAADATSPTSNEELFQALDTYPWDQDAEFQAGLSAILGANSDPEQVQRLTLRARCFYYARKHEGVNVDFPAYLAWHRVHQAGSDSNGSAPQQHPTEGQMRPTEATVNSVMNTADEPPPYPMTFTQIVELISTGAPIPGIKDIPDTLLEGQSTTSTKPSRRKPWEKDQTDTKEAANGGSNEVVAGNVP